MKRTALLIALLLVAPVSMAFANGPLHPPPPGILPGPPLMVDSVADLPDHAGNPIDSWFVAAKLKTTDTNHELFVITHQLYIKPPVPQIPQIILGINSIFDRNDNWYSQQETMYAPDQVAISSEQFSVVMPNTKLEGGPLGMSVTGVLPDGAIDLQMAPQGPVLYNCATGSFPLLSYPNWQYSFPRMVASGTITINGVPHPVTGEAWLDRQYVNIDVTRLIANDFRWTWMNIQFDQNSESVSMWDIVDLRNSTENAWATVLGKEGKHEVASIVPLAQNASEFYVSPVSAQSYPTRFLVRIPSMETLLEVVSIRKEQEIISPFQPKYEGAATVRGLYKGRWVTGDTFVEMVGNWQ